MEPQIDALGIKSKTRQRRGRDFLSGRQHTGTWTAELPHPWQTLLKYANLPCMHVALSKDFVTDCIPMIQELVDHLTIFTPNSLRLDIDAIN